MVKRILAIIAIILLVGMYASTLVVVLIGGPNVMTYLGASIAATLIIPVLLFCGIETGGRGYEPDVTLVERYTRRHEESPDAGPS